MNLCQVCQKEPANPSGIWCTNCYVKWGKEHNAFGAKAIELWNKLKKEKK